MYGFIRSSTHDVRQLFAKKMDKKYITDSRGQWCYKLGYSTCIREARVWASADTKKPCRKLTESSKIKAQDSKVMPKQSVASQEPEAGRLEVRIKSFSMSCSLKYCSYSVTHVLATSLTLSPFAHSLAHFSTRPGTVHFGGDPGLR